jgi:hypothetical protein
MTKWEYIEVDVWIAKGVQDALDTHGEDGWEAWHLEGLVRTSEGMGPPDMGTRIYFKRPLAE